MPTALPRPPRRVERKRGIFDIVLNTFMVLSALILTFMVLVREHGYANGQPGTFAGTLTNWTQQVAADQTRVIPPSN